MCITVFIKLEYCFFFLYSRPQSKEHMSNGSAGTTFEPGTSSTQTESLETQVCLQWEFYWFLYCSFSKNVSAIWVSKTCHLHIHRRDLYKYNLNNKWQIICSLTDWRPASKCPANYNCSTSLFGTTDVNAWC